MVIFDKECGEKGEEGMCIVKLTGTWREVTSSSREVSKESVLPGRHIWSMSNGSPSSGASEGQTSCQLCLCAVTWDLSLT